MARKTRNFRFRTPSCHGLKIVVFGPLNPITFSFRPDPHASKVRFCNKLLLLPPQDYSFSPEIDAKLDPVHLPPMLPWPRSLEIGFMLPNRSAGAWRFWKLGYLSNPISFSLLPGRPFLFSPPSWHGPKNTKFPVRSLMVSGSHVVWASST